ncbi:MAG: modification methylase HemK, partial [Thermoplasmatota archaeon]
GGVSVLSRFLEQAPGHLNPGGRIYLILSSKMDQKLLKELLSPFYVRRLGEDSFFFERLDAVELRR